MSRQAICRLWTGELRVVGEADIDEAGYGFCWMGGGVTCCGAGVGVIVGRMMSVHLGVQCYHVDGVAIDLADVEVFFHFGDVGRWDMIGGAPDFGGGFGML